MDDEPFELSNPEPRVPPARFDDNPARQSVLFTGLDCLPGQQDLFTTDGEGDPCAKATD